MPEQPDDYELVRWFDFSPMRPDEYYRQEAATWQAMLSYRNAIEDGRHGAISEKKAFDAIEQMSG